MIKNQVVYDKHNCIPTPRTHLEIVEVLAINVCMTFQLGFLNWPMKTCLKHELYCFWVLDPAGQGSPGHPALSVGPESGGGVLRVSHCSVQ